MGSSEVKKMENKKAALLVLAVVAAVAVTAGGAYALGMQSTVAPGTYDGYGGGPSMMGGSYGYHGGMMGAYGQAGYPQAMQGYMQQYIWDCWNSTATS